MKLLVEHANKDNLDELLNIFEICKIFMRENGNKNQWGNEYPGKDNLLLDIKNNELYVVKDNDEIVGVFKFFIHDDITYKFIEGNWINNSKYGVIHRVATKYKNKGIGQEIFDYCFSKINHLRIDTHKDNIPMQHLILKNNFKYCGIIYLENGDKRNAYEKI